MKGSEADTDTARYVSQCGSVKPTAVYSRFGRSGAGAGTLQCVHRPRICLRAGLLSCLVFSSHIAVLAAVAIGVTHAERQTHRAEGARDGHDAIRRTCVDEQLDG